MTIVSICLTMLLTKFNLDIKNMLWAIIAYIPFGLLVPVYGGIYKGLLQSWWFYAIPLGQAIISTVLFVRMQLQRTTWWKMCSITGVIDEARYEAYRSRKKTWKGYFAPKVKINCCIFPIPWCIPPSFCCTLFSSKGAAFQKPEKELRAMGPESGCWPSTWWNYWEKMENMQQN